MDVKKSFSLFVLLLALLLAACLKDDVKPSNGIEPVRIGEQVWMAKNMDTNVSGSFCYKGDSLNCKKYGRLYTWDAAQKVCPGGFRLPTKVEFDRLLTEAYTKGTESENLRHKTWAKGPRSRYCRHGILILQESFRCDGRDGRLRTRWPATRGPWRRPCGKMRSGPASRARWRCCDP